MDPISPSKETGPWIGVCLAQAFEAAFIVLACRAVFGMAAFQLLVE